MADHKGTVSLESMDEDAWFVVNEADCNDSLNALDELFDESTVGSNISNLIDDAVDECDQGNSLALFNTQVTEECERAITELKRKYVKSPSQPSVAALSPRLEAIRISPQKRSSSSKRKLFEDSGIGDDETSNSNQVETENGAPDNATLKSACQEILLCKNSRAKLLAKFEEFYGVTFSEITRKFKSDKTMCENWIVAVFATACEVLEGSKQLLQQYCNYVQLMQFTFSGLYLLQFKHSKNRDTVIKLFCKVLNIQPVQIICEPPKIRSLPTALYFYKQNMTGKAYVFGNLPDWISKQTQLNHQLASQPETFELCKMVQWAYDNQMTDEPSIAYYYALLANEDVNAAAFLKSNNQVRYVRDCCAMVRLYLRQEMRNMSMTQWIFKCCDECEGEDNWKVIINFLKFQRINIVEFLCALRLFFKKIPKKQCILIYGEPDTGKSYFCFSLIRFLKGKVVSYLNKQSNFWLQPLLDSKIGFLDDATYACWLYIDVNMRNALDGNTMCVDQKHKAPQQYSLPPFFVTSNVNIMTDDNLRYLHSRIVAFEFPNKLPLDADGNPMYKFTDQAWKAFFLRLQTQLDLQQEDNEPERPGKAFRCTASPVNDSV
uniref:Replication protein E1 n=1 Tax=Human papillomavirus TaxID=10566 RepID=A0A385PIG1_9PAPI|nr:MAG: E1 protein [Human papillomavirus]